MDKVIIIISLSWLANLFVHFWISLMKQTERWITAKPFSCQECMGFWIGLIYAIAMKENIIIFAPLVSLSAVLLSTIIDKINR